MVGDWWLVVVGSGWQLAVGRRWRLAAVGGWRLVAVGGWWLAVGGPLGRSLAKKKISSLKDRPDPLPRCGHACALLPFSAPPPPLGLLIFEMNGRLGGRGADYPAWGCFVSSSAVCCMTDLLGQTFRSPPNLPPPLPPPTPSPRTTLHKTTKCIVRQTYSLCDVHALWAALFMNAMPHGVHCPLPIQSFPEHWRVLSTSDVGKMSQRDSGFRITKISVVHSRPLPVVPLGQACTCVRGVLQCPGGGSPPPCISCSLVQATVAVVTVLIWDPI